MILKISDLYQIKKYTIIFLIFLFPSIIFFVESFRTPTAEFIKIKNVAKSPGMKDACINIVDDSLSL